MRVSRLLITDKPIGELILVTMYSFLTNK